MISRNVAGSAFDALADTYDRDFTDSAIGRAQRDVVTAAALRVFAGRERLLELNCGTGADARRFAAEGWNVLALDASAKMVQVAASHSAVNGSDRLRFRCLASEEISLLTESFDGVFSNFSGLNCVRDLSPLARALAARTSPESPLVLCFSTRVCLWETLWYLLLGQPRKAFRRWSGQSRASVGGSALVIFYPTVGALRSAFAPYFTLEGIQAVGLTVPPSYLEARMRRHPRLLAACIRLDRWFSRLPLLRVLGDHMLLTFRKTIGAAA